jgi:cell division protein FtsI (penicillin-binding protein 3)
MHAPAADPAAPAREPWHRRLVGSLLYGSNVDRVAKTRARILLAVLIFALGYAVIATRLVMFATAPEGHGSRRAIAQDAVAPSRTGLSTWTRHRSCSPR